MHKVSRIAALAAIAVAAGVQAQSSCSSDGRRPPTALMERFINADCATCWGDPQAPAVALGAVGLDWIVRGSRGDDSPLSAAAVRDARARLQALREEAPAVSSSRLSRAQPKGTLRVAHGRAFNDYIGTSIEWRGVAGEGPWTAWLVLVESVPAGTEGSPIARNLVRNTLQIEWRAKPLGSLLRETRSMRIPQGAKPERLAVVGWVEEERGRVGPIAQSHCVSAN